MKVELKLYATLMRYLPEEANGHSLMLDLPDGTTPAKLIADRNLPEQSCFLVLVDGTYLTPAERESRPLKDGDTLSIWPPIAGG